MTLERAPAKVNLLLHVGPRRSDGLHELCSLFASIDLADELTVGVSPDGREHVAVPGVEGRNLCEVALEAFRAAVGDSALPPLAVTVEKRIPIAAGLGGGSADAAAVLRGANELAGRPLGAAALRAIGARVGADVPSQIEPSHALIGGAGEVVEAVELPAMALVLLPRSPGLATADVYREADRIGSTRARLDPAAVASLAGAPLERLADALENDLEPAALSLRPELVDALAALGRVGALAALITGSGPTAFGVFASMPAAAAASAELPGSTAVALR